MNILHINNLASVSQILVDELKKQGHNALLIGIQSPITSSCDVEIIPKGDMSDPKVARQAMLEEFKEIRKRIDDFDIIHIHGGLGITGTYYFLYKKFHRKKKIIIHFHGTDLREDRNTDWTNVADKIFVSTPDLLKYSSNII